MKRFTLALSMVACACASSAEPVPVSTDPQRVDLAPYTGMGEFEQTSPVTRASLESVEVAPLPPQGVRVGLTHGSRLFRTDFHNESNRIVRKIVRVVNPRLDEVVCYRTDNGHLIELGRAGAALPFDTRPLPYRAPSFDLVLDPGESTTIWMLVTHYGSLRFDYVMVDPRTFQRAALRGDTIYGLYLGGMIVLILYNLYATAIYRESVHFYTAGVIAGYCLFDMSSQGFGFQYLWQNATWWQSHSSIISNGFVTCMGMLLARQALETTESAPILDKVLVTFAVLMLLSGALNAFDWIGAHWIANTVTPASMVFTLYVGIYQWRQRHLWAGVYLFAWSFGLAGAIVASLVNIDVIPSNVYIEHSHRVGFGAALVFFSLALTNRKRISAKQYQEKLAAEVEIRTHELREALDNVKTLKGFVPICSNCKKARDDEGFWQQLETYIEKNSDAHISHGICPDCMKELYPEYADIDDDE